MRLGETQGRTRNDQKHCIQAPIKDVYLYALSDDFRAKLSVSPPTKSPSIFAGKAEEQAERNEL